jgi:hypothetical protein
MHTNYLFSSHYSDAAKIESKPVKVKSTVKVEPDVKIEPESSSSDSEVKPDVSFAEAL